MVMLFPVQGILIEIDFATPRSFQGNVTIYDVGFTAFTLRSFWSFGLGFVDFSKEYRRDCTGLLQKL